MTPSSVHSTGVVAQALCLLLLVSSIACCSSGSHAPLEPGPDPNSPFFEEPFSYSSDTALAAAVAGIYDDACGVHMATGTLFDGSTGQFLRTCQDTGVNSESGVDILPFAGQGTVREFWMETYIRFSAGWTQATDDKTLLVMDFPPGADGGNRWDLHLRYGRFQQFTIATVDTDGVGNQHRFPEVNIFNNGWHQLRIHYRMSTSPRAQNGIAEVWIDGQNLLSRTGWDSGSGSSNSFGIVALGRNTNPANGSTRDWGRTRVWVTSPGW